MVRVTLLGAAVFMLSCAKGGPPNAASCPEGHEAWSATREDGTLEQWCKDAAGLADGPSSRRAADGSLLVTGAFAAGRPTGLWQWYFPGSSSPEVEVTYAAGLPHGLHRRFRTPDGALVFEHAWAAGAPCGTWKEWDEAGALTEISHGTCDGVPVPVVPSDLVAPAVTSYGWDGVTCPAGVAVDDPVDSRVRACSQGGTREGPLSRWDGEGPLPTSALLLSTLHKVIDANTSAGVMAGAYRTFWPSGTLASTGQYEGGFETGPFRFYRADRSLREQGAYAAGLRTGIWLELSSGGITTAEGSYALGQREGLWLFRGERGLPTLRATYVDGRLTGPAVEFHPDGQQACAGDYLDDAREGAWTCTHPTGQRASAGSYRHGQRWGVWEEYESDGRVRTRSDYEASLRVGVAELWEDVMFFGQGPWRAHSLIPIVDGQFEGVVTGAYELPGTPRFREALYQRGLREGEERLYWPTGQLGVEARFFGGQGHGHWRAWGEDGVLRLDSFLDHGRFHGPYRSFWEDGSPRAQGNFELGAKRGVWTWWSRAGTSSAMDCSAVQSPCAGVVCDSEGECL